MTSLTNVILLTEMRRLPQLRFIYHCIKSVTALLRTGLQLPYCFHRPTPCHRALVDQPAVSITESQLVKKFPDPLFNRKYSYNYRLHKTRPSGPVMNQINPL